MPAAQDAGSHSRELLLTAALDANHSPPFARDLTSLAVGPNITPPRHASVYHAAAALPYLRHPLAFCPPLPLHVVVPAHRHLHCHRPVSPSLLDPSLAARTLLLTPDSLGATSSVTTPTSSSPPPPAAATASPSPHSRIPVTPFSSTLAPHLRPHARTASPVAVALRRTIGKSRLAHLRARPSRH